jgi:hypothetical protein
MYRRFSLWVVVVIASYLILTKTTFLSSLWALFFLGLIPATTIYIPWWILATFYLAVLWAGLLWLNAQPVVSAESNRKLSFKQMMETWLRPLVQRYGPAPKRTTSPKRRSRTSHSA